MKMIAMDGSGNDWLWDRNKFINRKFIMQEMYQNFVEGEPDWDLPQVRTRTTAPAVLDKRLSVYAAFELFGLERLNTAFLSVSVRLHVEYTRNRI